MSGSGRPKAGERRRLRAVALQRFVRAVGRRSDRNGLDPNDRNVDPRTARVVRRLRPLALDVLLRDGEDEA